MKKFLVTLAALFVLCGAVHAQNPAQGTSALTMGEANLTSLVNVNSYSKQFLNGNGLISRTYTRNISDEEYSKFASLSGDTSRVDTPLEIALLSYSAGVINVRPVEADRILPANNPRLAGLKLGSAVYKELTELRFLDAGNTQAVGRYEGMLKFIQDKHGLTRAEIEAHYRQGIAGLVGEIVDEEFNKISFRVDMHNATLTHNPKTGQYTLYYGGVNTNNDTRSITANSLEVLSSEMRNGKNKSDFTVADLRTVAEQAKLIPATVYARWQTLGVARGVDALALIKETLTKFYLNPSRDTYNAVQGIYARYSILNDIFANLAERTLLNTLSALNQGIAHKIIYEHGNLLEMRKIPNDRRYDVFSTPYGE
jgi:hypothetical protein